MNDIPINFSGLSDAEVISSREKYGWNAMEHLKKGFFWSSAKEIVFEPMFLLLVATSTIYFILGEYTEGFFLLGAILLISTISFFQNARSRNALDALKEYTQTLSKVIRNKKVVKIPSEEIVLGDFVLVQEGEMVTADGIVVQQNDFSVNESILTGEAFAVTKLLEDTEKNQVYQGTAVVSGQCIFQVTAIGKYTKFGEINTSLGKIEKIKSPLQFQINLFVKQMAIWGALVFLVIWGISFYNSGDILDSLLRGLTIAMSVLPEEIPVAFATFMALGAYRLMQLGIIVKHTQTIETLGSATVICTDKTGTITQNKMQLFKIYDFKKDVISEKSSWKSPENLHILTTAMWASEMIPFDPMEKSLHHFYQELVQKDERPFFKMVHEYPLGGTPPMMTHLFENVKGKRIIAVKGAPEAVILHSNLKKTEKNKLLAITDKLASEGLRVLAVAEASFSGSNFPKTQEEFEFQFLGCIAFYDPPKENIVTTLKQLYDAGIDIKIITGDNAITTKAIAEQVKFKNEAPIVTGNQLQQLSEEEFDEKVRQTKIFTRIFPEVKLRIINSLKKQNQIVGMTGDGVNDAPALKASHIGIAMGQRGSDVAKEAASLILSDDDFGHMVDAVAMGRKIYLNLKKAIQYIISIHIPIILTVALPLILGWIYPVIFTPIHVIFLELIMGPTCSIIYENEPLEKNSMQKPPRALETTFLNWKELFISIIQGLVITAGCLIAYQYSTQNAYSENITRSMVFGTLLLSNIFLTLVNRSFYYSVWSTFQYKNRLIWIIISITFGFLLLLLYQPTIAAFFKLEALNLFQFLVIFILAFVAVLWFEIYKWILRLQNIKSAL
ncbi:MAG: haloacid dehalogenase [Flavobacteriaceae bacterium CG_4_8_14_3_um_filter_34_10]|nr:cation-translocating P-type ATPase [Flavobacteriia bacterium]PIQ18913.1 MAG: haloacid dehalogenase [Flavobacteriaceae bacterium CG18_big_fil_WC_8_21_14_2_50_34_36]PIX10471.1 MAG: haloacid dehalogenase [Flavobacteriaceae bacterium CG_4_8_14_3_um_filter_34_10]PJC07219.1 MAG: haloacid dehalogenase [Flavobacteriaceae bacterium CG_4_9_14_0_8_um_filter_34_30]